jgi:hypothetical protein
MVEPAQIVHCRTVRHWPCADRQIMSPGLGYAIPSLSTCGNEQDDISSVEHLTTDPPATALGGLRAITALT